MNSSVNQEAFKEWIAKAEPDDRETWLENAYAYGVAVVSKNEQLIETAYEKVLECTLKLEEKYQVKFLESPDGSYRKAMLFLMGVASQVKKKRRQASENQKEKKIPCKYCGKEILKDSKFCNHCGKALDGEDKHEERSRVEEVKVFDFSGFSYNKSNIKKINEWLQSQSIEIKSISINTFMNNNIPLKWETVPNRVEIKYYQVQTEKRYKMGYFKSLKWIGHSYDIVSEEFELWQQRNADKKVIWKTFCGHQCNGGSTQSIYFLYI